MTEHKERRASVLFCQHPVLKGAASGIFFFAMLVAFLSLAPAARAYSFQVGDLFIVNVDSLSPWVSIFVGFLIWWDAHQAKKHAAAALATAQTISKQVDGMLVDRDKANIKEGEARATVKAENKAETLATGQEQGRAQERVSQNTVVPLTPPPKTK